MPIDPEALLRRPFPEREHAWAARDTILYALGVGAGPDELPFVFEDGLRALPSMVNVLGFPGFWAREPDTGIDWRRLVHAEQSFVLHRPLPPEGRVLARNRVTAVHDKGEGRGALLCQERVLRDAATGAGLATVSQVSMLRADGGRGSASEAGGPPPSPPPPLPDRTPDAAVDLPTLPQAALIYRLSGDWNPLHADPAVAAAAGFPRPILHGLCTMGVACRAALRVLGPAAPIRAMRVRFSAPVLPGDTIRTEFWRDGAALLFRSAALERGTVVLTGGRVEAG